MVEVKICFLLGYEKQENDRDPIIVFFFILGLFSDLLGHYGRRDLKINDYRKTYLKGKKKNRNQDNKKYRETSGRKDFCFSLFCF